MPGVCTEIWPLEALAGVAVWIKIKSSVSEQNAGHCKLSIAE